MDFQSELQKPEYDFLRNNPNLGNNIILIGLGGSYSYGTNVETSDIDIRGIAVNKKKDILIGKDFEQVVDVNTDTTIYSLDKMFKLWCACNPNTIELLGLKPEHYLYATESSKELLKNKDIFLSKIAVHSFGGYANAQLRRLESKSARELGHDQMERYILNSMNNMMYDFKPRYNLSDGNSLKLYIDKSAQENMDTEIFMDIVLKHYPLRDYASMYSELSNVVKDYSKLGKRNQNAMLHDKIGKHMMHLVRLYLMCFDILERHEINTYRVGEDHNLLMSIRNGEFLSEDNVPTNEFYEMVDALETRLEYDKNNTDLPDTPDMDKVQELQMSINEKVVRGENI